MPSKGTGESLSRVDRRKVLQALGGAGVAGLAGCSGDSGDTTDTESPSPTETDSQPTQQTSTEDPNKIPMGGELVVGVQTDVQNYDSIRITSGASRSKTGLIYERLTAIDFNLDAQPYLAEDWEWLDDTTVRFDLREGVTFHNGDPFNAASVQASIERSIDTARDGFVSPWYDDSEIIDDTTIEFQLKEPFGPLVAEALPEIQMVPEGAATGDVDLSEEPIGTGPYAFEEHDEGSAFRVTRNEDHWFEGNDVMPDTPPIEDVTFRVIPEPSSQASAVQSGEIDVAMNVPAGSIPGLRDNESTAVQELNPGGTYIGLAFPVKVEPWDNVKIRQGVTRLMPREPAVDLAYDGLATPAYQPVGPLWSDPYIPDDFRQRIIDEYVGTDREAATQLLEEGFEEAGIEKPFETNMVTTTDPNVQRMFELIQQELNNTEFFDISLEAFDVSTYYDRWLSEEQMERNELSQIGITGSPTPYEQFNRLVTASGLPPGCCNRMDYVNEDLESLLDDARQTPISQTEELVDIYQSMVEIVAQDCPKAYLVWEGFTNTTRSRVQNWQVFYDTAWGFSCIYSPFANAVTWIEDE